MMQGAWQRAQLLAFRRGEAAGLGEGLGEGLGAGMAAGPGSGPGSWALGAGRWAWVLGRPLLFLQQRPASAARPRPPRPAAA